MFSLHPQLQKDTFFIQEIGSANLYLMNDARYTWLILVPRVEGVTELHDLSAEDYKDVTGTIRLLSERLSNSRNTGKINIGALGNMVPQLHIHIIHRTSDDPAWPGPVWGHSPAEPYTESAKNKVISDIINLTS